MDPQTGTIIVAVITALTSSGVMSIVLYLMQRRDKKKDKEDDKHSMLTKMLVGLGHDKIVYLTDKYIKRGAITVKEKRNLKCLVTPYFALEGNGDAKIGWEACEKLDIVSDDEADELDVALKRREYGLETE